jgi:hypothetical protein
MFFERKVYVVGFLIQSRISGTSFETPTYKIIYFWHNFKISVAYISGIIYKNCYNIQKYKHLKRRQFTRLINLLKELAQ